MLPHDAIILLCRYATPYAVLMELLLERDTMASVPRRHAIEIRAHALHFITHFAY